MRKLALFSFLLVFGFVSSFTLSRSLTDRDFFRKKKDSQKGFSTKVPYVLKNRPFVIVVVGRNNGAYIEKTLSSVFSQTYEHVRLIYVDDASDDGSFDVAKDIVQTSNHLDHVTLVRNEEPLGDLASIRRAALLCSDEEIIVLLDGEDWLAHEWVLQRLNIYYDDPNLWMSLSQGVEFPNYQPAPVPDLQGEVQEKMEQVHLKSFYASLFKKLPDWVFADHCEISYMAPMLEIAQDHSLFIPEVLYVREK